MQIAHFGFVARVTVLVAVGKQCKLSISVAAVLGFMAFGVCSACGGACNGPCSSCDFACSSCGWACSALGLWQL